MKNILVMCNVDPNISPRPNRMIGWLKDHYRVTVVGRQKIRLAGTEDSLEISTSGLFGTLGPKRNFGRLLREAAARLFMWLRHDYEGLVWASLNQPQELCRDLSGREFDLIISHDLNLLPLAFAIKGERPAKIMLDAREYYPRNFDDRFFWRMLVRPLNEYLCSKYLPLCDKVITVCEGLANEYKRVYRIDPEVIMSLPQPYPARACPIDPEHIKIIHHGNATPSRKIELMIETMDHVDGRFSLDLMLMGGGAYLKKLHAMASTRKNVRLVPPVPMPDIVPTINRYDIGMFLMPTTNFNLTYALPNKLFEFIQGRLAVAISPSVEMRRIVEKYDCGIVAADYTPRALAEKLNALSAEKITYFKQQSNRAAAELNADSNRDRVLDMVAELIERG